MRGKSVFNLFFENSTRTRTTFEIAAKRPVRRRPSTSNIASSSTSKGESLLDTVDNLTAMSADMFVVRHAQSGAPFLIARHLNENGLDHIHVVQRRRRTPCPPDTGSSGHVHDPALQKGLLEPDGSPSSADVLHSRVARSDIHAMKTLGVPEIRVIGPTTLLAPAMKDMGIRMFNDMNEGLKGVDVIIMLRVQNERINGALLPSAQEFFKSYGLTPERLALAKPDAIVMHPGPMNRGVEIDSAVADGDQAVILSQVTYGIAVRMAVMSILAGN